MASIANLEQIGLIKMQKVLYNLGFFQKRSTAGEKKNFLGKLLYYQFFLRAEYRLLWMTVMNKK